MLVKRQATTLQFGVCADARGNGDGDKSRVVSAPGVGGTHPAHEEDDEGDGEQRTDEVGR